MKLSSSKSTIISPGHHLRGSTTRSAGRSGVLVSPLFEASIGEGRKRSSGSGFENSAEPSSPKVSCIGQVRFRTRKHMQKKKKGARSVRKRKGGAGGSTTRSAGAYQSDGFDRLVHLPVAICESIRSFGSDLNCFSPCGSRASENGGGCGGRSSCGAAFTQWFVTVEETSGGKRREIELVVGGSEEEEHDEQWRRNQRRRHVFDGIDLDAIEANAEKKKSEDEEEAQFVPPKNALLLMRCRSNSMKAAALANHVRQRSASLDDDVREEEGDIDEDEEEEERRKFRLEMEDKKRIELCQKWISGDFIAEIIETESVLVSETEKKAEEPNNVAAKEEEERIQESVKEAEIHHEDPKDEEIEEQFMSKIEVLRNLLEEDAFDIENCSSAIVECGDAVKGKEEDITVIETLNQERIELEKLTKKKEDQTPDCLPMMICEPKVSKEYPAPAPEETDVGGSGKLDNPKKQTSRTNANKASSDKPPLTGRKTNQAASLERPRLSWSSAAAPPPLVSAVATGEKVDRGCRNVCEPLVLTRCKSEPRKSAVAKLVAPEGCFWKNMKMVEAHQPAPVGVGSAGVGF